MLGAKTALWISMAWLLFVTTHAPCSKSGGPRSKLTLMSRLPMAICAISSLWVLPKNAKTRLGRLLVLSINRSTKSRKRSWKSRPKRWRQKDLKEWAINWFQIALEKNIKKVCQSIYLPQDLLCLFSQNAEEVYVWIGETHGASWWRLQFWKSCWRWGRC